MCVRDSVTPGVYRAVRVNLGGLTDLHFPGGDKVVVATYRQMCIRDRCGIAQR